MAEPIAFAHPGPGSEGVNAKASHPPVPTHPTVARAAVRRRMSAVRELEASTAPHQPDRPRPMSRNVPNPLGILVGVVGFEPTTLIPQRSGSGH